MVTVKFGKCCILVVGLLCLCPSFAYADNAGQPYARETGTIQQFGFIGGVALTSNPNMSEYDMKKRYTDFCLGAVYDFHDYLTRQIALEVITSLNMQTAKATAISGSDNKNLRFILPVDFRLSLGPSEDFTAYIGGGMQWNVVSRSVALDEKTANSLYDTESIHQLSGNAAAGFYVLGPKHYRVHFSLGARFHFPIVNNSEGIYYVENQLVDVSRDKSCLSLAGSMTIDLTKRKSAALMLNYELPLSNSKVSTVGTDSDKFFSRTQMLSLGVMFHLGGLR